jgi:hypothetical protein
MLARHIGYEVIQAYYVLQDVLCDQARKNDYDFYGFYELVKNLKEPYLSMVAAGKVSEIEQALRRWSFDEPLRKGNP